MTPPPSKQSPPALPKRILLLGTDASGKNHVAAVWAHKFRQQNTHLDIREGWLNAKPVALGVDDAKSSFSKFAEACFINVFPILKWFLPPILSLLLLWDSLRFRKPKTHLLVVSHKALRILAFTFGQKTPLGQTPTLPRYLQKALGTLKQTYQGTAFVLDVEPDVRMARIRARLEENDADPFDLFMAKDSVRSEQIEACLISITTTYLGAHLIENNQLSDDALWQAFQTGLNNPSQ